MAADHFMAPFAHLDLPCAPNIHTKKKYAKQMKVSAGAYLADLAAGKSGHDVSAILEASNSGSPLSLKNLKVSLNSSCPSLFSKNLKTGWWGHVNGYPRQNFEAPLCQRHFLMHHRLLAQRAESRLIKINISPFGENTCW